MFYVYIMVSMKNGMFYIGQIDDIYWWVWQYKMGVMLGFVCKYKCWRFVWFVDFFICDEVRMCEW